MGILNFLFGGKGGFGRSVVSTQTEQRIQSDWKNIKTLLASKGPSQLRQALITADKTLDSALKDIVAGETMGERLKNAKDKFDRDLYNKIWEAHKIRNALVHEAGYEPPYHMVTRAIENLKTGLQSLRVKL
jgi:hypothetical protein